MKELKRKVIDDYYLYNGKKIKSFRVIFDYRLQNGEVKTTKPRFKKKSDAEAELTRLIEKHQVSNGNFVLDKDEILLKDYAEDYKKELIEHLSPTSHANAIARINEAVEVFGCRTLASITRTDIKAYKRYLKKKVAKNAKKIIDTDENGKQIFDDNGNPKMVSPTLSDETVKKYLTHFRAMLKEAGREFKGLPEFDFTGKGIIPPKGKSRELVIDFFDFDKVLEACTGKQAFLKLFCIALWETGGRTSEINGNKERLDYLPGVKRKDIYFDDKRIKLWNSKLHPGLPPSFRIAYLSDYFRDALLAAGIDKLEPDELVFRCGDFRDDWYEVRKNAGLDEKFLDIEEDFWMRDFRHCFTTNADDAGVSHTTIQYQINQVGDSLLEKVYINVKDEKLTKKFERFEKHSKEQRALVEATKNAQKVVENPIVTSNPEPIQPSKDSFDFSFLPTFRKELEKQTTST